MSELTLQPAPICLRCGWEALIGALAGALLLMLLIKWMTLPRELVLAPPSGCALHQGACRAAWSTGGVTLALEPRPLRCLAPLTVALQLAGPRPAELYIDFQGEDFPTAFHRTTLASSATASAYTGTATLPLCARGSLRWQARVVLDYGNRRVIAPFRFVTQEGIQS